MTFSSPASELLTLFCQHRMPLLQRVQRMVGSDGVAEEIVQDTFLKLWRKGSEDISPGLLYRTATNLALDHLRACKVRSHYAATLGGGEEALAPSTEEQYLYRAEWEALMRVLEQLPERARRIFLLNRVEGETYRAIAEHLDVSVSTVEKDMMRVMRLSRQWLLDGGER